MPNTPYYIRPSRTFTMRGKPGDRPRLSFASRIVSGGPVRWTFHIGSSAISNGNGRTILDDVAPSFSEIPNTSYYALVTTDCNERPVVDFQVSSGTTTWTFFIKVENHRRLPEVIVWLTVASGKYPVITSTHSPHSRKTTTMVLTFITTTPELGPTVPGNPHVIPPYFIESLQEL